MKIRLQNIHAALGYHDELASAAVRGTRWSRIPTFRPRTDRKSKEQVYRSAGDKRRVEPDGVPDDSRTFLGTPKTSSLQKAACPENSTSSFPSRRRRACSGAPDALSRCLHQVRAAAVEATPSPTACTFPAQSPNQGLSTPTSQIRQVRPHAEPAGPTSSTCRVACNLSCLPVPAPRKCASFGFLHQIRKEVNR